MDASPEPGPLGRRRCVRPGYEQIAAAGSLHHGPRGPRAQPAARKRSRLSPLAHTFRMAGLPVLSVAPVWKQTQGPNLNARPLCAPAWNLRPHAHETVYVAARDARGGVVVSATAGPTAGGTSPQVFWIASYARRPVVRAGAEDVAGEPPDQQAHQQEQLAASPHTADTSPGRPKVPSRARRGLGSREEATPR